jgi:endonuclease/exonuclease/phosphatase family metal-dependent hydrolase
MSAASDEADASYEAPPFRLLSWNVRDLLGDPLAVCRVIVSARADVVVLQEAPRWPGSRWRLAGLARATGLVYATGGREAGGCALLTSMRIDVVDVWSHRLPVSGWRTRPRGWVLGRVRLPGEAAVVVAGIHLGLSPQERSRHVALILAEIEARSQPGDGIVVAGDLNEPPGSPSWTALERLVRDPLTGAGPTFPARAPNRRIDAVLAGPPSAPVQVRLVADEEWSPDPADLALASDHRPVLVELRRSPDRQGRG